MQVTNVRLFKSQFESQGSTKAFGQLELDNAIVLDIEVREKSPTEQWVSFPGYKTVKDKTTGQEKKQSRIFIKDQALRETINREVIGKYTREIKQASAPSADTSTPQNSFPF
jgi:DNA-binding cell septation regulator SpoVG